MFFDGNGGFSPFLKWRNGSEMKVRISDIGPEGLEINDTLPADGLNARLNEGGESEIIFEDSPEVRLRLSPLAQGAELRGAVSGEYRQPCGRCNSPSMRRLEASFHLVMLPEGSEEARQYEDSDDIGVVYFSGDQIELDDSLQEAVILQLSIFWLPDIGEPDGCPNCNAGDMPVTEQDSGEEKVLLGDLLQRAAADKKGRARRRG